MDTRNNIMVAAFDGTNVCLYDLSQITPESMAKVAAHFNELEQAIVRTTEKRGYDEFQQFVYAISHKGVNRAHWLLSQA